METEGVRFFPQRKWHILPMVLNTLVVKKLSLFLDIMLITLKSH